MNEREARLVQIRWRRSEPPTITAAVSALPAGAAQNWRQAATTALRQALGAAAFAGSDAVTCLAPDQMRYHYLNLAPMPDADLPSAVQFQLAKELDWPVNGFRSEFYEVGEALEPGKRRREVIAVAARMPDLEAHVEMLREAGLNPVAIDAGPAALARGLSASPEQAPAAEAQFVIELGVSCSTLMIARSGLPRFIRSIPIGRRDIVERAAAQLNTQATSREALWAALDGARGKPCHLSAANEDTQRAIDDASTHLAQEIAHQVTLCMHYLADNIPGDAETRGGRVIGGGSREDLFMAVLSEASGIDFVRAMDSLSLPLRSLTANGAADQLTEAWLLPLGLAMYGHEPAFEGATA